MKKYILILGLITALNAKADDEITIIAQTDPNNASTKCGYNCTWKLYSDGKLEISGTGDMYGWGYYEKGYVRPDSGSGWQTMAPWGEYSAQISDIKINSGITSIGYHAFYNVGATNVEIADSVTTIVYGAFQYSALQSVSLPNSITQLGGAAFYNTKLSSLIVPDSVTQIGDDTLWGNLNSIFISDNVASIGDYPFTANTKIYCAKPAQNETSPCSGKSDNIEYYSKDENGVYQVGDSYFSSPESMLSNTICNNTDGTCAAEAAAYKAQKAQSMAGGALCTTQQDCLKLMDMAYAGTNCTTIASCSQWLKLNRQETNPDGSLSIYRNGEFVGFKNKRIYTVEEANLVAKPTGNTVRIKYR